MSSETPADPPKLESKTTEIADPPNIAKTEVEYDDFGLPIRKARARTPVVPDSDSEEEQFQDAVTSKSATRENLVLPEQHDKVNDKSAQQARDDGAGDQPAPGDRDHPLPGAAFHQPPGECLGVAVKLVPGHRVVARRHPSIPFQPARMSWTRGPPQGGPGARIRAAAHAAKPAPRSGRPASEGAKS